MLSRLVGLASMSVLLACSSPDAGDGPDGGLVADAGDGDAAPASGSSSYLFDDDVLRTYELEISQTNWEWLQANATLEQYVPGMLTFEGRQYGPVAVRYKGSFGTLNSCFDGQGNQTCSKLSMKIKFNEYDPEARFHELKKINFHSMSSDPSLVHDRLAYSLYRQMGVPAPRAVHARLIINGELMGLFALVEQIDGRFTRMNYADGGQGNLYKEVWPLSQSAQPYLAALRTNEDENPDVTPMMRFATALAGASDQTIEGVLEQWTDVDQLMAYLAVDRAIENWDGIVGFWCVGTNCGNHNYYWYQDVSRDFVTLIPWDMDNTFDQPNFFETVFGEPAWDDTNASCDPVPIFDIGGTLISRRAASCDPLIRWLATVLRPRYLAASETLLDGPFRAAAVDAQLDKWEAQIASAVAEDTNGPGTALWMSELAEMRRAVGALRADVGALVGR
ncbi:MAG TPA: CotH kinase family protein [Kofleriaceae bacterium]|nr:CotH kinase family protein [Kofleriaceae bacterium]